AQEFAELAEGRRKVYYRRMRRTFFVFLVVPVFCFFIPYISIQFTIWMLWLLAAIVFLELPCIRANRELMCWKKERLLTAQRSGGEEGAPRHFELSQAGTIRRVKTGSFLLPVALSAAAVFFCARQQEKVFYQSGKVWTVAVLALCTPAFYAVAVWMDRQRTVVISRDSEINLNFARAKKQAWYSLWLFCAWMNTAYTIFAAFLLPRRETWAQWLIWSCIAYTLVLLAGCARTIRRVSRLEEHYAPKTDPAVLEEDDDYWLWGCVYYNRADKRTLVEARIGFGTSVNLATPLGKGLTIFGGLAILIGPIACVWMILLEFTPIHLEVRGDELVAQQLKTDYRIDISDIAELTLVEELPELSKIAGTGMDHLYKGKWHIVYAEDCEVFLNPQNHLFLRFVSDGVLY
ncbi:MAG: hypothetical protein K2N94_15890, partial [Lachnospiraceae bacterium]|nr:hypothetical protein [Lachnospiraceae bacterium]